MLPNSYELANLVAHDADPGCNSITVGADVAAVVGANHKAVHVRTLLVETIGEATRAGRQTLCPAKCSDDVVDYWSKRILQNI